MFRRIIALLRGKKVYIDNEGYVRASINITEGSYIKITFEELGRIIHLTPKSEPISIVGYKENTSSVGGVKKLTQQELEYRKDIRKMEGDKETEKLLDNILEL